MKLTAIYWLALFAATHFPGNGNALEFTVSDKFSHFAAFTILAAMVGWTYFLVTRGLRLRDQVMLGLLLAAYGAVDEWTQPLVGRGCELLDWVADVGGIVVGLFLAKLLAKRRGRSKDEALA